MPLAQILDEAIGVAEHIKNHEVAHGRDALQTQLIAYRGDRAVALAIFMEDVSDARLLRAIAFAAFGFDADTIVLLTEAITTDSEANPVTGRRWRRGELDDIARHLEPAGWASPTILVTAMNRAGDICVVTLPYSRQGGFTWLHQRLFQPEDADLAPGLRAAMKLPSAAAVIPEQPGERGMRDNMTADHLEEEWPCKVRLLGGGARQRRSFSLNPEVR